MDLSIIIVNWNTRDLLKQCLESVYSQLAIKDGASTVNSDQLTVNSNQSTVGEQSQNLFTDNCLLKTEIFVVDNASSDGSAAMVSEQFPQVCLIQNCENVGFARANNQAIRASAGRYVLLLNSDTIVQSDALTQMVAFMDAYPDAGITGANILNPDGTAQSCFWEFPSLVSEIANAWGLDTHLPFSRWFGQRLSLESAYLQTDWVLGAAMMIRRDSLNLVGLLDETYFMYSEELDLAYRFRHAGWKTYVLGDARIIHLGQQSSKQRRATMKAQLFRSKVLYFRKHHGRAAATLLKFMFGISMIVKCWVYRLQRKTELAELWLEAWQPFAAR